MIRVALSGQVGDLGLEVAFEVPATGITGVMGRSGSGKTTVLRALAGLERLSGHVQVKDAVWQDAQTFLPPHHRALGYVFQEASLFSHLSVKGNLDFAVKRSGKAVNRADITELLQIGPLLDRAVTKLSGGERQRVAMARALLSGPEVLLMDEPLSSLDQAARQEILPFIRRIADVQHIPLIYVSHDPLEMAQLTERVLYMSSGRLVEKTSDEVSLAGLSQTEIEALARIALRGSEHLKGDAEF